MFGKRKMESNTGSNRAAKEERKTQQEDIKKQYKEKFGDQEGTEDASGAPEESAGSVREELGRQRDKRIELQMKKTLLKSVRVESLDKIEDVLSKYAFSSEYSEMDADMQEAIMKRFRDEALSARPGGIERVKSVFSVPDYNDVDDTFRRGIIDALSFSILMGKTENVGRIKSLFSVPDFSAADPDLQRVLMDRVTSSYILKERPEAVEEAMSVFDFSPPDSEIVFSDVDTGTDAGVSPSLESIDVADDVDSEDDVELEKAA